MQILDLYLGDVRSKERFFKRNSQYAKALDEVIKVGVKIMMDVLIEGQMKKT